MAGHDPVLILLIIILALVALGAARGKLQSLKPSMYRRDHRNSWRFASGDYRVCTYCKEQTTSGVGPDDAPMCGDCKDDLLP